MNAVEFLFSLERFGMKFGLENMRALSTALDRPEQAFSSVIVAGTNGKGSVTAMTATALQAAGHRVARYTSPHLDRLSERFVIDGREVDQDTLLDAAERIRIVVERLVSSGVLEAPPTFFECTTAIAFDLFRRAGVEVGVIEVGLGGRLDATNIVTPIAGAIVSIAFDHQAQLGDTIASIAREKAGVIKPGVPVVCGAMPPAALAVIEDVCRAQAAPLVRADQDVEVSVRLDRAATRVTIRSPAHAFVDVPLALQGRHQAANAAVTIRLLEVLHAQGIAVPDEAMTKALRETSWAGRLERMEVQGCDILIDAAHNPAGAAALAAYLLEIAPGGATLVFGAMRDKAVADMLGALAPVVREIICTTAPTPRALGADALVSVARELGMIATAEADPLAAVDRACRSGRLVVVAGSIFLTGPLRTALIARRRVGRIAGS